MDILAGLRDQPAVPSGEGAELAEGAQIVGRPMTIFAQNEPLTDAEFDRLGEFLMGCKGGKAMNVEELDGFFAALIAGPEIVLPSEYMPVRCSAARRQNSCIRESGGSE